jgi:hypothetical protein
MSERRACECAGNSTFHTEEEIMNRLFTRVGLAGAAVAATLAMAAPAYAAAGPAADTSPAATVAVAKKGTKLVQDLGTWSKGKRSTHNLYAHLNAQTCIHADVVKRGKGYKFSLRDGRNAHKLWESGKFYDSHPSLCGPWVYHEGPVYTRVETTGTLHAKVWIYAN